MYLKCIYVINSYRYVIVKMPKMLYYIYIYYEYNTTVVNNMGSHSVCTL